MRLFQCDKCGCRENTALTNAAHGLLNMIVSDDELTRKSYCLVVGIEPGSKLGNYCSACTPLWFTRDGNCGFGPNPFPTKGAGLWHQQFARVFYPLGSVHTGRGGNLEGPGLSQESSFSYAPAHHVISISCGDQMLELNAEPLVVPRETKDA